VTTKTTLADATGLLRAQLPIVSPVAAIVLGSGLGGLAERIDRPTRVPYGAIPGFAETRIDGHAGELIHGTLGGREVLALAGRFHMYEGYSAAQAAFPVRVVASLGTNVLILSNAAGGIRRTLRAGQLMVIADHMNLTWTNPLIGALFDGDERFPDMSSPYDVALRSQLLAVARELGIPLEEGVYAGLMGPSYETPAEVRMLERFGVDAVGMSTVAEVLVARAIGLRAVAVSCISNAGAGQSLDPISHEEVMAVTMGAAEEFERLMEEFVRRL
jgi:purine-nucleoside phosphorylase